MRNRWRIVALIAAVAAVGYFSVVPASGSDNKAGLKSSMAPSTLSGPTIRGVTASGAFTLERGSIKLGDGKIDLKIRGLLPVVVPALPATPTISARLFCGADATPTVVTTTSVPISSSGEARIKETFAIPVPCLAPIVLVHANGVITTYIAVTGFSA